VAGLLARQPHSVTNSLSAPADLLRSPHNLIVQSSAGLAVSTVLVPQGFPQTLEKIKKADPEAVITDCLSCRLQFTHALPYPVFHPLELISQSYDIAAEKGQIELNITPFGGSLNG